MAQSKAWILGLDNDHQAAVGNQNMVEYIMASDLEMMPLPLTPAYCPGVMVWRQQIIPIIDIARLLSPAHEQLAAATGVMVLAYQKSAGEPVQHGAIVLRSAPRDITVNSDMACPLPAAPAAWQTLALACFSEQGQSVPILNAQQVFSSAIHQAYEQMIDTANVDMSSADTANIDTPSDVIDEEPVIQATTPLSTNDSLNRDENGSEEKEAVDTDTVAGDTPDDVDPEPHQTPHPPQRWW